MSVILSIDVNAGVEKGFNFRERAVVDDCLHYWVGFFIIEYFFCFYRVEGFGGKIFFFRRYNDVVTVDRLIEVVAGDSAEGDDIGYEGDEQYGFDKFFMAHAMAFSKCNLFGSEYCSIIGKCGCLVKE